MIFQFSIGDAKYVAFILTFLLSLATFNSLFEMPETAAETWHGCVSRCLSILYWRCRQREVFVSI